MKEFNTRKVYVVPEVQVINMQVNNYMLTSFSGEATFAEDIDFNEPSFEEISFDDEM